MQVMHVNDILHGLIAEFVGLAVDRAGLHAATSHPHREAVAVVVASVDLAGVGARGREFDGRGAAEFAAPDDEGLVEHAEALKVGE